MAELDLLIRGAALGIMALTVVMLSGRAARNGSGIARRKWLAVCITAVMAGCYLLISSPIIADLIAPPVSSWASIPAPEPQLQSTFGLEIAAALRLILITGAMLAPVSISWMVMEIFFDQPSEQGLTAESMLGIAAMTVAASVVTMVTPAGPVTHAASLIRGGLALLLYLSLILLAIRSGPDDLVPARRRFRRAFVSLMALTGIIITSLEITVAPENLPTGVFVIQALAFLSLSVMFGLWLLNAETPLWPAAVPQDCDQIQATASPADTTAPRNTRLITRINQLMETEIWRREGLTMAALAQELTIPEHRLRTTINGQMGYRNFSALINGYRINAACAALIDPARQHTTVLEIAYECGFASLGPFNRAFRAQTGQSPTEYRHQIRS